MSLAGIILSTLLVAEPAGAVAQAYETRTVRVPGTTVEFEMVRCPAGRDEEARVDIPSLWVLKTEVPWELYDIYVYGLDRPEGSPDAPDAVTRPSKPYVPPDRGFGHDGYPAMGMTRFAAEGFCAWLSDVTGTTFRLPAANEWVHLAAAGNGTDLPEGTSIERLDASAWFAANADHVTHPVGRLQANPFGLHDTLGNVAEWVVTDTRRPIAMGGSYRDPAEACGPTASQQQDRTWNASDPQIPKSKYWLADCSWVGFRFVSEADPAEGGKHGE